MKLFEITTGHIGESYVRSYAWAHCADDASRMFADKCVHYGMPKPDTSSPYYRVRELFDERAAPFCTFPNDHGWPDV